MTLHAESFERDVEQEEEKSAMAAEVSKEPRVEELLVPSLPPIHLESILSASTMGEWWNLLRESVGTSKPSQFHWDILSFCKAYELTAHQMQLRRDALACMERAVHDIWPSAEVHLFGSIATGLALPWSDIDVAIIPPNQEQDRAFRNPPTPLSWQNALSRNLNRLGQCRSLQKVPFAKVPILKAVFNSGIACDVSFDVRNSHSGVAVVRQFMERYQACRPLCLVLKFFLGQNSLNELHTGGLGSFCIITMVVSHLQKMAAFDAGTAEGRDLGTLLLSFFAHYSSMHDYSTDVVSTRGADWRSSKLEKGWVNLKYPQLLAVEDPLDATSDIAKGSYRIEEVRKKFSYAQRVLLTHWSNAHVLAHLVDMTVNPTERPSPEKAKKSKRESRKRRRASTGQEERNSPDQPALKVQRMHHSQQGSGLVTKRQLDSVLAKRGPPHLTFSIPTSQSLRTGGQDEKEVRSVQKISPKTPSPNEGDSLRRSHGNATLETPKSSAPKVSPMTNPSKSCSTQQCSSKEDFRPVHKVHFKVANEGSIGPSNCSDSIGGQHDRLIWSKEANNSTASKLNASNGLKDQAACPIQSSRSQPCHREVDGQGNQDETLLLEFWESQLTARPKPRRTCRRQRENSAYVRDLSTGEDSMRDGSQKASDNSAALLQLKKPSIQSVHSQASAERPEAEKIRGNQDDKILEGFWESHLRIGPKQRKASQNLCSTDGYNTPAQTERVIHPERPLTGIKNLSNAQDGVKLPQQGGPQNNNLQAQNGNEIHAEGQGEKSVKDFGHGNNKQPQAVQALQQKQPQAVQAFPPKQPQRVQSLDPKRPATGRGDNSVKNRTEGDSKQSQAVQALNPKRPAEGQDDESVEVLGTEGNEKQVQAGEVLHLKRPESDSEKHSQTQNDELPQKGSCGSKVEHVLADQVSPSERSQKGTKIQPRPEDEKAAQPCRTGSNNGQIAPAVQTSNPKLSQNGSMRQPSPQDEKSAQPCRTGSTDGQHAPAVQTNNPKQPQNGSRIQPRPQGEKSAQPCTTRGNNGQHAPAVQTNNPKQPQNGSRVQPRPQDEKSAQPCMTRGNNGQQASAVQTGNLAQSQNASAVQTSNLKQSQSCSKIHVSRPGDEKLAVDLDFWEAQLTTKRKAKGGSVINHSSRGGGKAARPALAVHSPKPAQNKGVGGGVQNTRGVLVHALEPRPTTKPKVRSGSLTAREAREKIDQPASTVQEEILTDFWEAKLAPRVKAQKSSHNLPGRAAKKPNSAKSSSVPEVAGGLCPMPTLHQSQHTDKDVNGRRADESLLVDFWEAQLAPRLKGYKSLPKRRASGCDVGNSEQQQPPEGSVEVLRVSPDERKLVDFWETHLNTTPRSKKCLSNGKQAQVEGDAKKPSLNAVGGSIDHGYDRKLSDFWEEHLTPSLKGKKGLLKQDTISREGLPPPQGNGVVGKSSDGQLCRPSGKCV